MAGAKKGPQPFQGPDSIDAAMAQGIRLLNGSLVFNTPGGQNEVEIVEVEPYVHREHDSFVDKFNKKTRQTGEIMLTWMRGNPQVFLVVSPDQQRIVYLRKFRLGSNVATFKAICDTLGITKDQIDALDGQLLLGATADSLLRLQEKPSAEIADIRVATGKSVNSLGVLTKGKNNRNQP